MGFVVLAFVQSFWAYAAFVLPLIALAVGLGIANGPALIALLARARQSPPRAIDRAAAAAVSTHTIPTQPVPAAGPHPPAAVT